VQEYVDIKLTFSLDENCNFLFQSRPIWIPVKLVRRSSTFSRNC